jgi:transposase
MTKTRFEVVTSVERRRHWTTMEKEQLVAATPEPGASVSSVARQAGMRPSQLYGWRRQLCARAPVGFAPVRIAGAARAGQAGPGTIDIEFAAGARIRITGAVDAATVTAAVESIGAIRFTAGVPQRRG